MHYIDAQRYFESLAAGQDPGTGAAVAETSVLRDPTLQLAVAVALRALGVAAARERSIAAQPPNLGKPWSTLEDAQLTQEFAAALNPADIAAAHGRSIGSIESRLQKLGLLTPAERTTRDRY